MECRPPYGGLKASTVYIFCIAAYYYPLLPRFKDSLLGPPEDNQQDLWNTWYSQKYIISDFRALFFTDTINYPEGSSLTHHSFSHSNLVFISIIRALFQLPLDSQVLVLLNNLMILLSFLFAGLGAFYLARYFRIDFWPAVIAGFIFAFSPFHVAHSFHHMHVATIQYIPFFVLFFLRYREGRRPAQYLGALLFFVLAALSSFYYLFYNALFVAFHYLFRVVTTRSLALGDALIPSAKVLLGGFLLLSPLLLLMIVEGLGNKQSYAPGHDKYVADLVGFFLFHPYHWLSGYVSSLNEKMTGNEWEMSVYLGLGNLGLLCWAFATRKAVKDRSYLFCLAGMGVFSLFAMGSSLHVLGRSLDVPLPTTLMQELPFLGNFRAPSRAMVYVYLFLSIATGLALTELFYARPGTSSGASRQVRGYLLSAIAIVIFIDFYPVRVDLTEVMCPPAYDVIRHDRSETFGVLDLPMTYIDGNRYMMYQTCHEKPIVFASVSRKLQPSLSDYLETEPSELQRHQLEKSKVKYIVVHKEPLSSKEKVDLETYRQQYRGIYNDQRHDVLQVF